MKSTTDCRPPHGGRPRLALIVAVLCLLALTMAQARPASAPAALIQSTIDELFAALSNSSDDSERVFVDVVGPHMDIEKVSEWVLGKHWRVMDAPQRERFIGTFEAMIARTYARAVARHLDARVEYINPSQGVPEEDTTVRTRIVLDGKAPLRVDYRLRETPRGWKVFDLRVEGVSLITTYRSAFRRLVDEKGIDGFLDALARRHAARKNV